MDHQDRGAEIRAAIDNGDSERAEELLLDAILGEPAPPAKTPAES